MHEVQVPRKRQNIAGGLRRGLGCGRRTRFSLRISTRSLRATPLHLAKPNAKRIEQTLLSGQPLCSLHDTLPSFSPTMQAVICDILTIILTIINQASLIGFADVHAITAASVATTSTSTHVRAHRE